MKKSDYLKNLINNMPQNLSQIEKAYYIYIELGKIVSENPQFVFTDRDGKEKHYGKIDSLTRQDIEQLDKKLGYSFFIPETSNENERGLYTEDTIELLRKDMNDPELFKKYVLHDKAVSEEELLRSFQKAPFYGLGEKILLFNP